MVQPANITYSVSASTASPLSPAAAPPKALLWQMLFERPREWYDFRTLKDQDMIPKGHPDFKHINGTWSLWLTGQYGAAPAGVLHKLATTSLEFAGLADDGVAADPPAKRMHTLHSPE
jgi:hypothetical protein